MRSVVLLYIVLTFSFCIYHVESKRKAQGKLNYEINWAGGVGLCDDVEQDLLNLDNLKIEKESATGTVLGGSFEIVNPIANGTQANAYVNKETDQGVILVTVLAIENICNHVADDDKPWTMVFDAMNLDPRDCPLPTKVFELDSLKLNLSSMDSFLNHDNVGEYNVRVELLVDAEGDSDDATSKKDDKKLIGCFKIGMSIDEVREKE